MGKKLTTAEFIEKDKAIHGEGYKLYDRAVYVSAHTKVELGCGVNPDHGYYWMEPNNSTTSAQGCPKCGRARQTSKRVMPSSEFVEKDQKVNGIGTKLYDRANYKNNHTKIELGCGVNPSHGYYWQTPTNSLQGKGCPSCAKNAKLTTYKFIEKHEKVHGVGTTLYDRVNYVNSFTKVELGCSINPTHGYYSMTPNNSLNGQGCPKCGGCTKSSAAEFIEKHKIAHDGKIALYNRVVYVDAKTKVELGCQEHGHYWQTPDNSLRGQGCPKCVGHVSKPEKEISDFLTGLGIEHETSTRSVIPPYELDIYIPGKKIAIEYCGLYWHSEAYKDSSYHYKKWEMCKAQGIQLITIYEDEWVYNKEVVKRLIANKVGMISKSLFARKCEFTYITKPKASVLLNEHHIQGASSASHYTGLTMDGSIVAVALFTRRGTGYELVRYCSSVRVVGGLSKLIKNFRKDHPGPIHTFADHRYSSGPLYIQAGFKESGSIPQDYKYIVKGRTHHKFAFRHKSLSTKLKNYDPSLTEHENCSAAGILRIYDCGKTRFVCY